MPAGWKVLVLVLFGAFGCSNAPLEKTQDDVTQGDDAEATGPIKSFTAEKPKVRRGAATNLVAVFEGGSGKIDHDVGSVESGKPIEVSGITESTTFTLSVTDAEGKVFEKKVDVAALDAPVVKSFAPAKVIRPGQETTLTAVFEGGVGTIEGLGEITSGTPKSTGILPATKTFTLTVTNEIGDKTTATTEVEAAVMPVITSFTAPGATVSRFAPTTLTATFTGGKGTIDNGVGSINGSGGGILTPKVPSAGATYTLTVTNGLGESVRKSVTVATKKELFVTDYGADILVFDADTKGNVAPKRVIVTENGGPTGILGIKVVNDEIYVSNEGDNPGITVYGVGDDGPVQPKRRIAGAKTAIDGGYMFSIDNGEIFLADKTSTIKVWSTTSTGNVAPKRALAGGGTLLNNALATTVFGGELYVSNYAFEGEDAGITVYPEASGGNTAPTRTIKTPNPTGLLVSGNELFVNNRAGEITVFNKQTGAQVRKIAGAATELVELFQCALADGELFCPSYATDKVVVFPQTANGNVAPSRVVAGEKTYIVSPASVYVY